MAFTSFSPVDIDEMLSQLATFTATELGWASNWSGGQLTLEPKVGEAVFTLSSEPNSFGPDGTGVPQIVLLTSEGVESFETVMNMIYSTSVCWFFGGAEPEPWLHIIIQVTPGTYRHAYLGYLERYGTWTGGAICDTQQLGHHRLGLSHVYSIYASEYSHSLFSTGSYWDFSRPAGRLGGVMIGGHGEAGQKGHARFGNFDHSTRRVPPDTPVAGGGPTDNYAQAVANPGVAPFSGETLLVPITIFADIARDGKWTPLGRVCGIRLVNINDFSPEQAIAYAGRTWRVFPLVRKPPSATNEPHSGNRGIAVLQDEV